MALINGQWVDEYDRSNWSVGPGGGQGLFNPGRQQVYWNQGTPSYQAPKTPTVGGIQVGPTTYGPTAGGWLGGGLPSGGGQSGQPIGSNPLPTYNPVGPISPPQNTQAPAWRGPTNWTGGSAFPSAPPTPPSGKLNYNDWYNQIGQDLPYSASFGSPGASYLDYLGSSGTSQQPTTPTGVGAVTGAGASTTGTPTGTSPIPSPTANTQIDYLSQLTPYGGQGSMNFNPFQPNPAGGTQQQGQFNSLPTYGFYA